MIPPGGGQKEKQMICGSLQYVFRSFVSKSEGTLPMKTKWTLFIYILVHIHAGVVDDPSVHIVL